jgi:GrpB-like predicted nucleotidyltransferase (UPF0157 family)
MWRQAAQDLIEDLQVSLLAWLDECPVEHIGSTSVPGLPAKPVVDIMAPVGSLSSSHEADPVLAEAGWQLVPPSLDRRPWRRFYVLPEGGRRLAHLHLVERTSPQWWEAIAFRDALRGQPGLAAAYARLKRAAAKAHPDDREGYTAEKARFIQKVLSGIE